MTVNIIQFAAQFKKKIRHDKTTVINFNFPRGLPVTGLRPEIAAGLCLS